MSAVNDDPQGSRRSFALARPTYRPSERDTQVVPNRRSLPDSSGSRPGRLPPPPALTCSFYLLPEVGRWPDRRRTDSMKGYVVCKGDRYHAVIYEGVDQLTGRERRRWHPAGLDPIQAEALAARLASEHERGRGGQRQSLTLRHLPHPAVAALQASHAPAHDLGQLSAQYRPARAAPSGIVLWASRGRLAGGAHRVGPPARRGHLAHAGGRRRRRRHRRHRGAVHRRARLRARFTPGRGLGATLIRRACGD